MSSRVREVPPMRPFRLTSFSARSDRSRHAKGAQLPAASRATVSCRPYCGRSLLHCLVNGRSYRLAGKSFLCGHCIVCSCPQHPIPECDLNQMPSSETGPLDYPPSICLPLTTPGLSLARAGDKGLNLAKLAAAGFPVPAAFIIATEAYEAFVKSAGLAGWMAAEVGNRATVDVSCRLSPTDCGIVSMPARCLLNSPARYARPMPIWAGHQSQCAPLLPLKICQAFHSPASRTHFLTSSATAVYCARLQRAGAACGRHGPLRTGTVTESTGLQSHWPWSSRKWCRAMRPACCSLRTR